MTVEVPLENLPNPSLLVDGEGVVVAANEDASDRLGDVVGAPFATLFVDDEAPPLETLREEGSSMHHVDGVGGTWQASVRASELGDDTTLVVFRDPGQRPPLERADGMLDALLSYIPVSVYFKDRRSRHVRVSASQARDLDAHDGTVHHTPADVEGKTEFDLYPDDIAEAARADDEFVMRTGEPIERRDEHVFQSGGETHWRTSKAPWYEDGELQGVLGVSVDITDQVRHARELERQNERLEEFASLLSHDIRNPLAVAMAQLDAYRRTGEEEYLDTVAEMHERMEDLVDDTLALATSGERVTDPTTVDARIAVPRAWSAVETGDATLENEWTGTIEADEDRLVQLLENLFRNAVEHGGDDVAVTVAGLTGDPGFAVEDDGTGIPEAEREQVFDRSYSPGESGTGFGLSIVREIAEAHGWSVRACEGTEGGARFEVYVDDPGSG